MRTRARFARLPTEEVHRSSRQLDRLRPEKLLRLMAAEDRRVLRVVQAEHKAIRHAARLVARSLDRGGRVIYLGAGTSGRLGVLEAAECPPTFGTRPDRIQAVVAGGPGAVFRAREGSEDRGEEAVLELRRRRVGSKDLVIGISASSVTRFVRRGLDAARRRGAATLLITCGPRPRSLADRVVRLPVGPEILAGSTRLKAATATKLALNAITLLAMIRLGKVYGPFMVDLSPGSAKLRDRARRIVSIIAEVAPAAASRLLRESGGEVKTAVVMAKRGLAAGAARRRLARFRGDLRRALSTD